MLRIKSCIDHTMVIVTRGAITTHDLAQLALDLRDRTTGKPINLFVQAQNLEALAPDPGHAPKAFDDAFIHSINRIAVVGTPELAQQTRLTFSTILARGRVKPFNINEEAAALAWLNADAAT